MLFQPPPRTPYDLNFEIFGFPVRVHPFFWLLTILLGASAGDLSVLLLWVAVVFLSILIHELGHSVVRRIYGEPSYIVLYAGGGLSVAEPEFWGGGYSSGRMSGRERINISLAGPFAGFLFAGLVLGLVWATGGIVVWGLFLGFIPIPSALVPSGGVLLNIALQLIIWVNIFWGLVNLLPVFPLDGGRISREIFVGVDPIDGSYKSLQLSAFTGAVVAVAALLFMQSVYMALLFGLLAFQSYTSMQGGYGRF